MHIAIVGRSARTQADYRSQILCNFGVQLLPAFSSFIALWGHWPSWVFLLKELCPPDPEEYGGQGVRGRLNHSQALRKHCWNHSLGR